MNRMVVSRRKFVAAAVVSSAAIVSALATRRAIAQAEESDSVDMSDEEIADTLLNDAEPTGEVATKEEIKSFWFQQPIGSREQPVWPADNSAQDFLHLVDNATNETGFQLSADTLQAACNAARFDTTNEQKVLFGVRGCILNDVAGDIWRQSYQVIPDRPNHIDPKCLIGVWDKQARLVAVFPGSTVPVASLMAVHLAVQEKSDGKRKSANLLPTGSYKYVVGPHGKGRQPGAFRQSRTLWVIRANKSLTYDLAAEGVTWDDMDGSLPFDNIHAASGGSKVKYSSAGCQVVLGYYDKKTRQPRGSWRKFRVAAGLQDPIVYEEDTSVTTMDDNKEFRYVLLTGKELFLASRNAAIGTLRYGSSGTSVRKLQGKLKDLSFFTEKPNGAFDRKTLGAFLKWQNAAGLPMTGILSNPYAADQFDLKL